MMRRSGYVLAALFLAACGGEVVGGDGGGFDAGPAMACETPGATESVPCGMCGTSTRFCTAARVWSYGPCEGAGGECTPGDTRAGACGMCGTEPQRCTSACAWESAGTCTGEGICEPGASVRTTEGCPSGQAREALCTDACAIGAGGTCEDNSCPTPGAMESVACGRCGTALRFCDASGLWQYDACMDEGECAPGTTDSIACGNCGTETARCGTECTWVPTGACMDEGECAPGTTTVTSVGCAPGEQRARSCTSACTYEDGPSISGMIDAGMPRVDAGACTETPCRLRSPQCGCPAGQACQVVPDIIGLSRRACGTAGTGGEGTRCDDAMDCRAGLVCDSVFCARPCETDADCPAGGSTCQVEISGADTGVCHVSCEPATSAGCPSGDACRWFVGSVFPYFTYFTECVPAGTVAVGGGCSESSDCVRNAACTNEPGGSTCERICRLEGSDCASCVEFPDGEPPVIDGTYYGLCN